VRAPPENQDRVLESGGGWIAPWLDRMDRHFDDQGFKRFRPQDAAKRVVPVQLLDLVRAGRGQHQGARRLYRPEQDPVGDRLPASDGFFPGAPDMLRERLKGTSPETQRGVFAGGAMGFYGLN